jgi:hypothetical protein
LVRRLLTASRAVLGSVLRSTLCTPRY